MSKGVGAAHRDRLYMNRLYKLGLERRGSDKFKEKNKLGLARQQDAPKEGQAAKKQKDRFRNCIPSSQGFSLSCTSPILS